MTEEVEVAETASDLAKGSGIKNYLWLYFLIVPLAASTASAVAIMIAALQGLSSHKLSSVIYAQTLLLSLKIIITIAGAYLIGLLLSFVSMFFYGNRKADLERRERDVQRDIQGYRRANNPLADDDEVAGDLGEYRFMIARQVQRIARQQQVMVGAAVAYSVMALVGGWWLFLQGDVERLWAVISSIADASPAVTVEVGANSTAAD